MTTNTKNITAGIFNKSLEVPTSKSYGNRLLVLAALMKESVTIKDIPESTDVKTMISCFRQIGLKVVENNNEVTISNSFPECESNSDTPIIIDSGDGGTTNRFIIPMLSRGKLTYHVNAHGHMRNRPMGELIRVLSKLKVNIELGDENSNFWIQVQGPIEDSDVNIDVDASESTQFATGMFLACYDLSLSINTSNMDTSATYFMLTKKLVELAKSGTRSYIVPPDASSLSYPLAAGLILGSINVTNCTEVDDIQADSEFIKIIKDIGGDISFGSTGLEIKSNSRELKGIDWDCSGCPDLVPTLAFTAAYLNNVSKIRNIKVLRHKESDRINEILKLLKIFKIKHDYSEDEDVLTINGCGEDFKIMEEVELFPPEDHRIVMVSYLFLRRNSGGILHNTGHVAKSFPTFFKVMEN